MLISMFLGALVAAYFGGYVAGVTVAYIKKFSSIS